MLLGDVLVNMAVHRGTESDGEHSRYCHASEPPIQVRRTSFPKIPRLTKASWEAAFVGFRSWDTEAGLPQYTVEAVRL